MDFEELKEKANTLPMAPGVYIMRDKSQQVIYVGKAKKLKNRVSQYFQDSAGHTPKTRMMVSKIHTFDVIVAASEFEALVLECSLIKQHLPKYNILLKDDKGYPYIRIDMKKPYPVLSMVNRVTQDQAEYFGPFGSRGVTQELMDTIRLTLKLPGCSRDFPRDIGKDRPCLNYHMNQCDGWCRGEPGQETYRKTIEQVRQLLSGNYKAVAEEIKTQMLEASEQLNFELAAMLRDRLHSVETLSKKQLVTAGTLADTDVIGFAQTENKSCFTVLHFSGGNLLDKDYEILSYTEDCAAAVNSLVKQYYLTRGYAPRNIFLPFESEDSLLLEALFMQQYGKKTKFHVPKRGDNARLLELAEKNALEEAIRVTSKEERAQGTLRLFEKMLCLDSAARIESYDISNLSGTDMVGAMVVFQDGKAKKSEYKKFRIRDLEGPDDYAAMAQVIRRRFEHYIHQDNGFTERPDLLLIDGGQNHAATVLSVLTELNLSIPVFGMVKDDKHRTRAIVSPQGQEIRIDSQQSVFAFVGLIQEQTHDFAIGYHKQLRSKRLERSVLDDIPGIGPKRKQLLLKTFGSLKAIKDANLGELERILPTDAATAVYQYFHQVTEA